MASAPNDNPRNESEPGGDSLFLSWPAARLVTGQALPGDLFLCIRHRMIKYKHRGDSLSAEDFDKLLFNRVRFVFIEEPLKGQFLSWAKKSDEQADAREMASVEAEGSHAQAVQARRVAPIFFVLKADEFSNRPWP